MTEAGCSIDFLKQKFTVSLVHAIILWKDNFNTPREMFAMIVFSTKRKALQHNNALYHTTH
jgi:hypothetical protein